MATSASMAEEVDWCYRSWEAQILHEQLDYLIDHGHNFAEPNCKECIRFERIRQFLLKMFETNINAFKFQSRQR